MSTPKVQRDDDYERPDWSKAVQVEGGGYMRLEDFCNSTERGNGLHFTSGVLLAEEELLGVECGWRVANCVLEKAVTGWDALLDLAIRSEHTGEAP